MSENEDGSDIAVWDVFVFLCAVVCVFALAFCFDSREHPEIDMWDPNHVVRDYYERGEYKPDGIPHYLR